MSKIKMLLEEEDMREQECIQRWELLDQKEEIELEIFYLWEELSELEKNRPRDPNEAHYADQLCVSEIYREKLAYLTELQEEMQSLYRL